MMVKMSIDMENQSIVLSYDDTLKKTFNETFLGIFRAHLCTAVYVELAAKAISILLTRFQRPLSVRRGVFYFTSNFFKTSKVITDLKPNTIRGSHRVKSSRVKCGTKFFLHAVDIECCLETQ